MTAIVLDASVAVKIVSEEQDSDAAVRRVAYAGSVIAPDWMVLETAHALWKKVQAEQFDQSAAEAGIAALPQIVDRFVSSMSLMPMALPLSYQLPHSLYDCLYLALAQSEGLVLLTADRGCLRLQQPQALRAMWN